MDKEKKERERERGRETRMTTSRTKSSKAQKNMDGPTDNELYSRYLVVIKKRIRMWLESRILFENKYLCIMYDH